MALQKRPSINIYENLISSSTQVNPTSNTVAFLSAEKGPGNKNIVVTDQVDFINKFGYPTEYNYKAWYNIYEYLRYVTNINVMRVINTSWTNFGLQLGKHIDDPSDPSDVEEVLKTQIQQANMYTEDIALNTLGSISMDEDYFCSIINRDITQSDDIAVVMCTSQDEYESVITTENDVPVFTKIVTALPENLTSDMYLYQQFILNNSGNYSVNLLDTLIEKEFTVSRVNNYTVITIANDPSEIDPSEYENYSELYFRNTKRKDLNNTSVSISSIATVGDDVVITLTEDLSLYDNTGTVLFYDNSVCWSSSSVTAGYLKSEEKTIIVTTGGSGYITYDDVQYKHIISGNHETLLYETCTRVVYDAKIQSGTTIKTFSKIVNKYVDFSKNFILLVFKKINGLFSLLEVFETSFSKDSTLNALYKRNYCEDIINQNSKYIYFKRNLTALETAKDIVMTNYSILDCLLTYDSITTDYTNLIDYTTFETATNFYRNTNNISIKYILGIELYDGISYTMNLSPSISEERSDCIAIISPWDETDYLDGYSDMTTVILSQFGLKNYPQYITITGTYTIVYDNMKYCYSEFLEKFIWIPIIGDIAGIYVLEDITKNPYTSCAGFKTTPIKNNTKMIYTNVSDDNLDLLCYHSINHVIKNYTDEQYYLYDILMYNDEELLTKRLNIRRTINEFKQRLKVLLKPYIFEYNTSYLRKTISNEVNYILMELMSANAINNGVVLCDSTNNPPEVINNNELHIQVLLQPNQVIRQIIIEINIEKQTIGFNEVEL